MRTDQSLERMIPLTALRHFYDLLRRFPSSAFREQAARECLRRPEQLQSMVRDSIQHVGHYKNENEPFHGRCAGQLSTDQETSPSVSSALLRSLASGSSLVVDHPTLAFSFVDYEVSPIRTTGSQFENGRSGRSSGTGGIDVLLTNSVDRLPIVGEVKVESDMDPLFGLVQALMYATELSTLSQLVRLQRHYPDRFVVPNAGPLVDIYLLLVSYPHDKRHDLSLELTNAVSEKLMAGVPTSTLIRRIVCLELAEVHKASCEFTVTFAHG